MSPVTQYNTSDVYQRPRWLFNRHVETVYPALFRHVDFQQSMRERINTPDSDFLDLDWYRQGADKLVIISHGLEGNTQRTYVRGMARACFRSGFDVLTWNYRGCSGGMNRAARFYHSGATDDLDVVVQHAREKYTTIFLVGFSLGGNLTLKYLGELWPGHQSVMGAVALSVPLELNSSCRVLAASAFRLYEKRFLKSLKKKVREKAAIMDLPISVNLNAIHTLREFDDMITAPLHGFRDAVDYYSRCSALNFLESISCPALIINARNDPFLSPACYPDTISNKNITTLYPDHGGHVGFTLFNRNKLHWSEVQAVQFFDKLVK